MQPVGARRGTPRIWFYLAMAVLVVSVWRIQDYKYRKIFSEPGMIFSGSSGNPPSPVDSEKMSVEVMTETNALLTTLATALLGALGLLLSNRARHNPSLRHRHMWAAFLAAVGAGLSLYFGYVSHLNLLAMVFNQTFSPYDAVYSFSSRSQFYMLLTGAFFFADFAFGDLSQEN